MRPNFQLDGKTIIVTGGLGQLGQHFSLSLKESGAQVVIIDAVNTPKKWIPRVEQLIHDGEGIVKFQCDITKRDQVESILTEVQSRFGAPFGLLNNAAIDFPPNAKGNVNGPFEDYPQEILDKTIDVNIKGTINCCQVFGKAMADHSRGSIVNIGSIYGMVSPNQNIYEYKREQGEEWFKPFSYSLTKSSLYNFTRYLSTYWAPKGVRVNTLSPAGVFNHQEKEFLDNYLKLVPMGRMANPEDLTGPAVFLFSDASSYMTGTNLTVDGGFTAW
jgi:NAD(P)-dependent dehydrogenase (short-subunit alcohol dehydrogenase family)